MKNIQQKINLKKEDNSKYYASFSYLYCTPLFKAKLFEYFDYDIKRCFEAEKKELADFQEMYNIPIPRGFFSKKAQLDPDVCLKNALNLEGVKILTYEDEKYPPLLREIPDFPLCLYYLGDLSNIDYTCMLAIVGSRRATNTAKGALNSIVSELNSTNIVIVSGLAYGIDATAHQAALDNNLTTIAVIGSGLDFQYPAQNKKLYSDIVLKGGIIFSEYHLKTEPYPMNFPQRNRIVVGMSKGTLVAEAQMKSGAMISANLTLDYNRELMCIPGNILNPNTSGIYHLIKNGAGIVTTARDLLNNLGWDMIHNKKDKTLKLTETQKKILDIISFEETTFDEIIQKCTMDTASVMICLTELELNGLIKQSNGKYFKNK
ncbi:MAG: DNA-processing protein DprA [Candidatus Gastranaerophilales bacterium]|nr:DNA-processing protein DprA [Candidatus Gastranaerophilales bacterium]